MMQCSGITHRLNTPYNPRATGKVERAVRVVKSILKKMLTGATQDWPIFLPFAQSSINNKTSTLTNSTPFSLMFGRRWNPFKDYSSTEIQTPLSETELVDFNRRMMEIIFPALAERVATEKGKLIGRMKKRPKGEFKKGDVVMALRPEASNYKTRHLIPFHEPIYDGPFEIISKGRNGTFRLAGPTREPYPDPVRAHQLKFVDKQVRNRFKQSYVVDKVMAHRGEPGNYEYLVHWLGYSSEDDSWVHESQFDGDMMIRRYWTTVSPTSVIDEEHKRSQINAESKEDDQEDEDSEVVTEPLLPSSSLPYHLRHSARQHHTISTSSSTS